MSMYPPGDVPVESVAPIRAGEMLAGKYRVERVLGIGGMGVVVAATHLQLDQMVAIKFLLPQAMVNPEVVARFAREARAAVKITSEHVARVIDVGELPTGAPYMVMEYLNGSDLSQVLTEKGALPIDEAVEYILQASEALAEAHAKGIVHRDLKPANLFLSKRADGSAIIKVLDFGISKGATDKSSVADMSLTKTSTMMGSPMYMSPEQMKSSRDVDWRTDIWALGVILYELIAGRPAFLGETVPELLAKIITEDPPPLRQFRGDAPAALEAVIAHCLVKNTAQRIANISELANALAPFSPRRGRASAERVHRVMEASGIVTGQLSAISLADLPPSNATAAAASRASSSPPTALSPSGAPPGAQPGQGVGGNTAASWSPATGHGEVKRTGTLVATSAVVVTLLFVGGGIGVWKLVGDHAAGGSAGSATAALSAGQSPPVPGANPQATGASPVGASAGATATAAVTEPAAPTLVVLPAASASAAASGAAGAAAVASANAPHAAVPAPAPRRPPVGETAAPRPAAPPPSPPAAPQATPHKNPLNIDIK